MDINSICNGYTIYGSCVTRDIFAYNKKDTLVKKYSARSSLISRMSPPLTKILKPNLSKLPSVWQQKMVFGDLFKNELLSQDTSCLIIDFIDERFRVLQIDNTFVTESAEFSKLLLEEKLGAKQVFRRNTKEGQRKWEEACHIFKIWKDEHNISVVLHQAYLATHLVKSNRLNKLDRQEYIDNMNIQLDIYYKSFIEICKPEHILSVPNEYLVSDPKHKWGLAPFHYISEYYAQAWQILESFNVIAFPINNKTITCT